MTTQPTPITESEIAEMKPAKDERGNPPNVPQGDDVMHLSRLANSLTIYLSPTERAMLRDAATALHWIRREAASWERVHVAFPRLAAAAREGIKAEKYRKALEEAVGYMNDTLVHMYGLERPIDTPDGRTPLWFIHAREALKEG